MKLLNVDSDNKEVSIQLTLKELLVLKNGLNEICHGPDSISESEFDTRIGLSLNKSKALLDVVCKITRKLDKSYKIIKW